MSASGPGNWNALDFAAPPCPPQAAKSGESLVSWNAAEEFKDAPTQVCSAQMLFRVVAKGNQMTREISLRKKPSNRRMNPPRKSRGIHDLLLRMATTEHSATNHMSKAGLRSLMRDYTTGKYATVISFSVSTMSLPCCRSFMQRRSWS